MAANEGTSSDMDEEEEDDDDDDDDIVVNVEVEVAEELDAGALHITASKLFVTGPNFETSADASSLDDDDIVPVPVPTAPPVSPPSMSSIATPFTSSMSRLLYASG